MSDQLFSTEDLHLANNAANMIKQTLDRYITLPELSKKVNTSPRKLKWAFEQFYMGQTISEMQLYLRMERAMILMHIEKMSINLVITQIGYKSKSGFIRAFKNVVGKTPVQWKSSLVRY